MKEIPDNFERIEHHDNLSLHEPERGIIIMVHERDQIERELLDKYPYKVSAAKNQKSKYNGVFDSESHAEDKVRELANRL